MSDLTTVAYGDNWINLKRPLLSTSLIILPHENSLLSNFFGCAEHMHKYGDNLIY